MEYSEKTRNQWKYDLYDMVCDRCKRVIFNTRTYSYKEMYRRIANNQLVIQSGKKRDLHFCNQVCKDLHRGTKFTENRGYEYAKKNGY